MTKVKLSKQAQEVLEYSPLIKVALIQRLKEEDILSLFAKNNIKMNPSKWYALKKAYNEGTNQRFIDLAKHEWADEHILILDIFKEIETKYWELFGEAESVLEGKGVLDSLRALQTEKTLFYNETPLIAKMKDTLESKLEGLNKGKDHK